MRRQFYDLKPGDVLAIDGSFITVESKSGQRVRLKVESDAPVQRGKPEGAVPRPYHATLPVPPPLDRPGSK